MSLPWVAEERRRQQALREAVESLGFGDRGRVGSCPEPVGPTGPWTFAALIGWWLEAGHALHEVSREGRQEVENRVGRGPGEGQYPPLWLAARFGTMRLPPDGLPAHLAASEAWASQNAAYPAYLQKLLLWVTNVTGKDRPRVSMKDPAKDPRGWVEALTLEFAAIREDAAALLGDRFDLETGPDLSNETLADWVPFWLDCRFETGVIQRVRKPVVHVSGGRRTAFIKGVAVLPSPGTVVRDVAQDLSAGSSAAAVTAARVLGSVAARWPRSMLPSTQVRGASQEASGTAELVDLLMIPAVRALVAAVAVAEVPAEAWRDALATVRLALRLDRFDVRPGTPPSAGHDRMVPHRGDPGQGHGALSFVCKAAGIDVPVGWLGEPAACDEPLLAAIEDVDWRLWALQHAPWDDATARVAAVVVTAAQPAAWEPLKRRILLEATDADAMSALYDFAHARRLALELLAKRTGPDAAAVSLEAFTREYEVLERVAFERLRTLDPESPARLDPPRLADATVDVAGWLARKQQGDAVSAAWRLEWVRDSRPAGTFVAERREERFHVVSVSAGSMTEEDLAILQLEVEPIPSGEAEPAGSLGKMLAELQAALGGQFAQGATSVDTAAALAALRQVWATDRAAAFHELIERWRRGDPEAAAWGRMLAADRRFGFDCHPSIDPASGDVAPPSPDDPFLEWAFDERVPAGGDIAITFALTPDRARRVISRGPRSEGSPAAHAEALVQIAGANESLAALARGALLAMDRSTYFGGKSPRPWEAVRRLLDALLDEHKGPADTRAAVFSAARAWCAAIGIEVEPGCWTPTGVVPREEVAEDGLRHEFHDTVLPGTVVVHGFGLRGPDGIPFAGAISAGPAPSGFAALREAVRALAGVGAAWQALAQRIDDLAKHAAADTLALAGSNLFDAVWQAAGDAPEGHADRVEALQAKVLVFLKEACRMIPFEPSAMGDYPTPWLREADGRQPRGRRIRRVVRPGLRTTDNTLVRPALVVTE